MADEALVVPHILHSFTGREIDFIHVHCIRISRLGGSGVSGWWDVTVSSSLEFPKLYHISVKLSCLVKPLFPFPSSLFLSIWEGSGGHHDSELVGYSSLEGIHEDAVIIDSAVCLGQFEGSGVFIKVSIKLVHMEGIDGLVDSLLDVFQKEGFFKGFAYLFESLFRVRDGWVGQLEVPSFGEGSSPSFTHFVEKD